MAKVTQMCHVLKYLYCSTRHITSETQFVQLIQLVWIHLIERVQTCEVLFVRAELGAQYIVGTLLSQITKILECRAKLPELMRDLSLNPG